MIPPRSAPGAGVDLNPPLTMVVMRLGVVDVVLSEEGHEPHHLVQDILDQQSFLDSILG